jgi:hypothetical protein
VLEDQLRGDAAHVVGGHVRMAELQGKKDSRRPSLASGRVWPQFSTK